MPFCGDVWTENDPGTSKELIPLQGVWKIGLGIQRNENLANMEGNESLADNVQKKNKNVWEWTPLTRIQLLLYWMLSLRGFQNWYSLSSIPPTQLPLFSLFISVFNECLWKYLLRIRLTCIVCHLQENKIFSCVRKGNKGWRLGVGKLVSLICCFLRRLQKQSRHKWARKLVGRGPGEANYTFWEGSSSKIIRVLVKELNLVSFLGWCHGIFVCKSRRGDAWIENTQTVEVQWGRHVNMPPSSKLNIKNIYSTELGFKSLFHLPVLVLGKYIKRELEKRVRNWTCCYLQQFWLWRSKQENCVFINPVYLAELPFRSTSPSLVSSV